jgi:hypothetical protein
VYIGPDVLKHFFKRLNGEVENINSILKHVVPMKLTRDEEESFHKAMDCHVCDKPLYYDRCRDHCHLTGRQVLFFALFLFYINSHGAAADGIISVSIVILSKPN